MSRQYQYERVAEMPTPVMVTCSRCALVQVQADQCTRCRSLLPGNTRSIKSGKFSKRFRRLELPGQIDVRAAVADLRAELHRDLQIDDLNVVGRDLVERVLQLRLIVDRDIDRVFDPGLTETERARAKQHFFTGVSLLARLGQHLGLKRLAKDVALTPLQWLQQTHATGGHDHEADTTVKAATSEAGSVVYAADAPTPDEDEAVSGNDAGLD